MKAFLKILLLIAAVFPIWMTIIAMGATKAPSELWRDALNSKLLAQSTSTQKIQILEIQQTSDDFKESYLSESFELDLQNTASRGSSKVELRFTDADGRLSRVLRAPVRLNIQELVVVAARDLPRQSVLQANDLAEEWMDAAQFVDRPLDKNHAVGRTTRSAIRAGTPIYTSQVDQPNLVKTGDRVRIIVSGNGISVTGTGIAKESGGLGETIRIMNPDSKREIYGTITADQKVEVRL